MKTILLTKGKFTIVDDDDFEKLSKFKWHTIQSRQTFYAAKSSPSKSPNGRLGKRIYDGPSTIGMHRIILNINDSTKQVDHIDGNGLNNQKSNLRISDHRQNQGNSFKHRDGCSSRFKGVSWNKNQKKWRATFGSPERILLGCCETEKEAALLYNVAASFAFREFAKLNKVEV